MTQKSIVQNLLIRISSILSVVFLLLGLVFMIADYFGAESKTFVSLLVMALAAGLAIFSLAATNFSMFKLGGEIKEAAFVASQLAQGDISFDLDEEESGNEIKIALKQIADNLAEKTAIANRMATGDLSANISPHSETDVFGIAFQNMID